MDPDVAACQHHVCICKQVAQQVAPEAKEIPAGAPADAREAMLSAIKKGQFQLRKARPHLKGEFPAASDFPAADCS